MTLEEAAALWASWQADLGPVAVAAMKEGAAQAPELSETQRAELAVILRRHPNPAAHDAA